MIRMPFLTSSILGFPAFAEVGIVESAKVPAANAARLSVNLRPGCSELESSPPPPPPPPPRLLLLPPLPLPPIAAMGVITLRVLVFKDVSLSAGRAVAEAEIENAFNIVG